ncbi:MAG: hypothetical protein A2086_05290 [Spirochaetes bacterium GWD1_27_9]|nr:MAG: hypothetical protein A2Z98_04940 [Spirochaetes bacterium GWB1_27_13]OHD24660.1 MAG: hypothetical protein A2Y34_03360 [Spirochaetes bacterium GWC1_27_15]OHD45037.1 MAG: hypothetical protein A2086_05290 [Spirochaetes bacterium GWD1_27_9]
MQYNWDEILRHSIVDNKIKASHLQHIPKLKDCQNWQDVKFLGRVNYKFKYTNYEGGLIKYNSKIYYINSKQIQAVSNYIKWDTSNIINVIEDAE